MNNYLEQIYINEIVKTVEKSSYLKAQIKILTVKISSYSEDF